MATILAGIKQYSLNTRPDHPEAGLGYVEFNFFESVFGIGIDKTVFKTITFSKEVGDFFVKHPSVDNCSDTKQEFTDFFAQRAGKEFSNRAISLIGRDFFENAIFRWASKTIPNALKFIQNAVENDKVDVYDVESLIKINIELFRYLNDNISNKGDDTQRPPAGVKLYKDTDGYPKSVQTLREEFGSLIDAGDFTLTDLGRINKRLYNSLQRWASRGGDLGRFINLGKGSRGRPLKDDGIDPASLSPTDPRDAAYARILKDRRLDRERKQRKPKKPSLG